MKEALMNHGFKFLTIEELGQRNPVFESKSKGSRDPEIGLINSKIPPAPVGNAYAPPKIVLGKKERRCHPQWQPFDNRVMVDDVSFSKRAVLRATEIAFDGDKLVRYPSALLAAFRETSVRDRPVISFEKYSNCGDTDEKKVGGCTRALK
ncbi:hypothetical protein RB195_014423 [Necator americanus]|uniref:Uncharacterized protein n=1 Tax=Necator americanus TaxID=51031 RepID=A0ABR1E0I2_NECAM